MKKKSIHTREGIKRQQTYVEREKLAGRLWWFLSRSLKEEGEGLFTIVAGREFHNGITSMKKENL